MDPYRLKVVRTSARNTKIFKIFNILRILPHFATKLRNFTNFKMLFLAVVHVFRSSCLDHNLVYSWNQRFREGNFYTRSSGLCNGQQKD